MSSKPLTVVTGGGSGMGRDIALDQVALGHDVLVLGRRKEPLDETRSMSSDPERVLVVVADASTPAGATAVLAQAGERPIRAVVAAAGGQGDFYHPGPDPSEVDSAWNDALRKNLFSAVLPIEALLPSLQDGQGRIVLIGSTAGLDGQGGPYAATKAALAGYGRDLAVRLGPRGITANTVAPGFVAGTDFFDAGGFGDSSRMVDAAAAATLIGRVGEPRDITACVRWLLSEDGGWITGQTVTINGGTIMVR